MKRCFPCINGVCNVSLPCRNSFWYAQPEGGIPLQEHADGGEAVHGRVFILGEGGVSLPEFEQHHQRRR